jgi:hypothetical protein
LGERLQAYLTEFLGDCSVNLSSRLAAAMALAGLFAWASGCSGPDVAAEQASTLRPLAVLYGKYVGEHGGRAPTNEAEFKAYAQSPSAKPILDANGIKDVETLFTSSRDKKPYVVLYGKLTGPPANSGQPVFAYEQEGVSGKRFVATSLGSIQEVDEAEFKKLVPTAP